MTSGRTALTDDTPPAYYPFEEPNSREVLLTASAPTAPVQQLTNADRGFHRHEWSQAYYPVSAYLCAILCFPIGLLCCIRLKERKCLICGEEREEALVERQGDDNAYRLGFAVGAVMETQQHHA
ncbi:hypothetical protein CcCBS67573_g01203 [Chytriomyces confervae]|uniref:Uncharacterized protein n=1 Tax=Chytriomyces confervae TaxID=246404 RepID=A0A507FMH6_9FUNG|nr:hypothetical protein CcCBS67573_g01203 [Chytriomyces confervae]